VSLQPADPKRTHALLVGVEAYAAGANWNLDGPALDVLAVHEWLTSHGVPAEQIRTFASALPVNQVRLDDAGINFRTASSNLVRAALSALKKEAGDLLVIFWAGHGAINDRQHRLFFTDASIEEKYNLEWEALRDALTSTAFEGFARQLVIIDACADFRNDFDYSAPGEAIPAGKPLQRELFAVFATSEGQTATNLGQDRRGLFSRELLRILNTDEYKGAWPPDMEAVADAVKKRFKELEREGVTQAPRFEVRDWVGMEKVFGVGLAPAVRTGEAARHLALVIGISQYLHGVPHNQRRGDEFTHLASPADDARALHQFLAAQPGYDVEDPLLDSDATLGGILRAVDKLRKRCRQGGQTALIYFSGHGVTDDEDRTFLVPHDARRDDLFASALWSKTLNGVLDEFTTGRLVVLLDACHAAGAVGVSGAKSAALPGFDPSALAGGSSQAGRFVVASCMARQRSYETGGHGIFTAELLELLRVSDPNLFSEEQIDLHDLYQVLRARVTQSAAAHFGGVVQQPFANFDGHTGIVMALNTALRTERELRRKKYLDALLRCVQPPVPGGRPRVDCKQRLTFETKLRSYVVDGRRAQQLSRLYDYLDERLQNTDPDDLEAVVDDCTELVRLFDEAYPGARSPLQGTRPTFDRAPTTTSAAPAPAKVAAPIVAPSLAAPSPASANALVLGSRLPVLSQTPQAQGPSLAAVVGSPDERRVLNEADVFYILKDIWEERNLFDEARELRAILTSVEGVSANDVKRWRNSVKPTAPPGGWEAMKDTIDARFAERFQTKKQPERASTLSIRVGRGD
jgi:hypothetical protein